MWAGLFTPDGMFIAGTTRLEGREQLKAFAWQHRPGQGPLHVRNFSANISIEASAEGATGKIFAVVLDIGEGGKPSTILNGGHYAGRLRSNFRRLANQEAREFIPSEDGPAPPQLPRPPIAKETIPVQLVRPKGPAARTLTAQDYVDIQQLAARYSHALDTGADNGYAYADLFTLTARRSTHGSVARRSPRSLGGIHTARNTSVTTGMNHLIEPTPDGAIGKQYVVVIDIGKDGKASSIFLGGQYQDVYAKTPNGWRFKSRTEFRSGVQVIPADIDVA